MTSYTFQHSPAPFSGFLGSLRVGKDEKGLSSVRQTIELFQRQCWRSFGVMRQSTYFINADFSECTNTYHFQLNRKFGESDLPFSMP